MSIPAVRGPPGFLNTDPQHGWSNGVPALRQRNRRACTSLSFAGGSSISASFASSTTTAPRLDERYLNEICLRGTCLILPFASMTVASVSTSANSAPCAPAFMYTPPPTVPGMPMKRSTPENPASAVRRASSGVARPARSEEHTSELQSPYDLVCRLLLEKKKKKKTEDIYINNSRDMLSDRIET